MPRRKIETEDAGWGTDRSSAILHISPSECEVRELVAIRAYELYLQRNTAGGGDDVTDWLTAEAEVRSCLQTNPLYELTHIPRPVNGSKKAATKPSAPRRTRKPVGASSRRRNSPRSEAA